MGWSQTGRSRNIFCVWSKILFVIYPRRWFKVCQKNLVSVSWKEESKWLLLSLSIAHSSFSMRSRKSSLFERPCWFATSELLCHCHPEDLFSVTVFLVLHAIPDGFGLFSSNSGIFHFCAKSHLSYSGILKCRFLVVWFAWFFVLFLLDTVSQFSVVFLFN